MPLLPLPLLPLLGFPQWPSYPSNPSPMPSYNPTDLDRATVACAYDKSITTSVSETETLTPSLYDVSGACVSLDGMTYWVVTLDEAKQIGIALDSCDTIQVSGRSWIICLT